MKEKIGMMQQAIFEKLDDNSKRFKTTLWQWRLLIKETL